MTKNCRDCGREISENALSCPNCGAPFPFKDKWDGWGYEYKSKTAILGMPLLHISFKFRPNFVPVPARGFISIGQFGAGVINISQFGIGVFSLSQFTVAGFAVCQIGMAYSLLAQIGLYWDKGYGQVVIDLKRLLELLA